MKKLIFAVLAMWCVVLLSACGGGSGSSASDSGTVTGPSVAALDAAKATLNVQTDKTTFKPAMVDGYFVHLSDGTKEVFVAKEHVAKIFFNGDGIGWHSADPTKGADLHYDGSLNPIFTIAGQPITSVFGSNFSFLTDDGRELSQITDSKWLAITVGVGMTIQRNSDGLLYGTGSGVGPVVIPPVAPVAVVQKTLLGVNTLTGEVEIIPVIVAGKLVNLVNSSPIEQVLDVNGVVISGYRIAWNDNGSWYPASGKVAALQLPRTTIASATKSVGTGAGMPYLVRPDGTFIPFNTDPTVCTFTVNGVLTKINVDGLMPY